MTSQWQPEYQPGRDGRPPQTPPQWGGRQPDPWAGSAAGGYPPSMPPLQGMPPTAAQSGQPQYQPPGYGPQFPPPGPPRRRKQGSGYGPWIAGGAVVLAAVAGGAFYVLHGSAPKPLTCAQQYQAWKTGPANADGKKLAADAGTISKAGEDIPVMTGGLKAVGADATALQAYPMPACADPAGYWQQYLGAMKAAGDNAGAATGLGGLILAEAPLKQVPGIQSKLTAELARTAGVKAS